jgi:hypothetical protein
MSVVAGCSLFNGVLIAADTRITFTWPDGRAEYADVAQKLFVVAPGTVLGFVTNDVQFASFMLRVLLSQVRQRRRRDPLSLMAWMPRLFRHLWAEWERRHRRQPAYTAFLVGSVLPSVLNAVRRQDVVDIMNRIAFGNPGIRRNWIPPILIQVLQTPPNITHVLLPGTGAGLLYSMESPVFEPMHHRPLTFTAIGTGRGVVRDMDRVYDWLVAGDVGNPHVEAMSFVDSIEHFARENGVDTVGGLYPTLRVDATVGDDYVQGWGYTREVPAGGDRIELGFDAGQWVQRNLTAGREIRLVPPWQVHHFRHAGVFDELEDAYRRMRQPAAGDERLDPAQ